MTSDLILAALHVALVVSVLALVRLAWRYYDLADRRARQVLNCETTIRLWMEAAANSAKRAREAHIALRRMEKRTHRRDHGQQPN